MSETPVRTAYCAICGKVPAQTLPIRRHVGMILLAQFVKVESPLCRDHGVETTKAFLKKSIVQGWWGVISAFVNVFVVVSDLAVLRSYRRLGTPERLSDGAGGAFGTSPGEWLSDPFKRFEYRWLGPEGWTDVVSYRGIVSSDPPGWL